RAGPLDQQGFTVQTRSLSVVLPATSTPQPTRPPTVMPTITAAPTSAPVAPLVTQARATAPPVPTSVATLTPATTAQVDSTPSAIVVLLGTLLAAGLVAGLAIMLTRHPSHATASTRPGPRNQGYPPPVYMGPPAPSVPAGYE